MSGTDTKPGAPPPKLKVMREFTAPAPAQQAAARLFTKGCAILGTDLPPDYIAEMVDQGYLLWITPRQVEITGTATVDHLTTR